MLVAIRARGATATHGSQARRYKNPSNPNGNAGAFQPGFSLECGAAVKGVETSGALCARHRGQMNTNPQREPTPHEAYTMILSHELRT